MDANELQSWLESREELEIARCADIEYIVWLDKNASYVQENPECLQLVKMIIYLRAALQNIAGYAYKECSDCFMNRRIAKHAYTRIKLPGDPNTQKEQEKLSPEPVLYKEQQHFTRIKQLCCDFGVKGLFASGGRGLLVAGKIMQEFEGGDICYETIDRMLKAIEIFIWQTIFYEQKNAETKKTLPAGEWNVLFALSYNPVDTPAVMKDEERLEQLVGTWAEERGYVITYFDDCYFALSNPLSRLIAEKAIQELKLVIKKWIFEYNVLIEDDICAWPKYSVADFENTVIQGGPYFAGGNT